MVSAVETFAVGGPALVGAELALAAMRRGRVLPALQAQSPSLAFGGAPVMPF